MKRVVVLFALLSTTPALAQSHSQKDNYPTPTQRLEITEGETVEGGVAKGDGSLVSVKRRVRMPGLIRPRMDFVPEMLRSAENL
jgi:hypothetical protein